MPSKPRVRCDPETPGGHSEILTSRGRQPGGKAGEVDECRHSTFEM